MGPGQKRPTDFDLVFLFVISVESRRSDDFPSGRVDGDQRTAGFQRVAEVVFKNLSLVTVADRMLFPNQRIGSGREKFIEIFRSKGSKREELAFQNGLEVEGQS